MMATSEATVGSGGRRALHRVTPVAGKRPRLAAVLCYNGPPGVSNGDAVRMLFWGRTHR